MSDTNTTPNEADSKIARRVLRRIAGAHQSAGFRYTGSPDYRGTVRVEGTSYRCGVGHQVVRCDRVLFLAAVEGAALGRAYAAALRAAH